MTKLKLIELLIVLLLLSCSKSQPRSNSDASTSQKLSAASSIPQIKYIKNPEHKEGDDLEREASLLLEKRDFVGVEALAARYRTSKEKNADGFWKLGFVYSGVGKSSGATSIDWQTRFKLTQDWITARPATMMPRIAMARLLSQYAWDARGEDSADKVDPKQWQPFVSRMQQAWNFLKQAKGLREPCPLYWSTMQRVALGLQLDKKQYNELFDQAIHEYPDYSPYYCFRANYLLPRWFGVEGEWEKDLTKYADAKGGEDGDVLYAQVVCNFINSTPTEISKIFASRKSAWERADRGLGIILKQFPDSLRTKANRAVLAGMAAERQKAKIYFLETRGEVDIEDWGDKESFDRFMNWLKEE